MDHAGKRINSGKGIMAGQKRMSAVGTVTDDNIDNGTLTVSRIVSVACRIMEESGVASVTMRRVASELGVTAMALYNHVADKQALLALVADSVISVVPDYVPDGLPWHERLRDEFLAVHVEIDRYPGLGLYIAGARGFYPSGLRKFHRSLDLLTGAGFDVDGALAATYLLLAYQGGYFLLDAPASENKGKDLARTEPGAAHLDKGDVLTRHDFVRGLETIIAGLRAQLAAKQSQ